MAGPEELGNGGQVQWVSGALERCQLTPGLISSFPRTARLLPFISFSTSYPELDFAALRPSCGRSLENGLCRRVLPMETVFKRSEEHTSELQSRGHLVCRLLLEKIKPGHGVIPEFIALIPSE